MRGRKALVKSVARLITVICLLSLLLSVGCIGCANGRPPALTLEQWEASRRAAGLGIAGGE
jgi:hypothetical protein